MNRPIQITRSMLERKLEACKQEAMEARNKSKRAFYTAEVERISRMLGEVA